MARALNWRARAWSIRLLRAQAWSIQLLQMARLWIPDVELVDTQMWNLYLYSNFQNLGNLPLRYFIWAPFHLKCKLGLSEGEIGRCRETN